MKRIIKPPSFWEANDKAEGSSGQFAKGGLLQLLKNYSTSCPVNMTAEAQETSIHWFRLDSLRMHDNPALFESLLSPCVKCIFILDDNCYETTERGPSVCVWRFLLESLVDLDSKLRKAPYNSRLFVFKGQPTVLLPRLIKHWNASKVTFQASQTSYESVQYDRIICKLVQANNALPFCAHSQTLFTPSALDELFHGSVATSFNEFSQIVKSLQPSVPATQPSLCHSVPSKDDEEEPIAPGETELPTLEDLGFTNDEIKRSGLWTGGETQALSKLLNYCYDQHDDKNTLNWLMSKDSLSPYFRFGCLSVRMFYSRMKQHHLNTNLSGKFSRIKRNLYLREYSYHVAINTPHFDDQRSNPLCLPIEWEEKEDELFRKIMSSKTGIPWIDAVVAQIINEGWAHYLARKSFAYFVTRGCLWQSWERGKEIFSKYMLDYEDPICVMCWIEDSCAGFLSKSVCSFNPAQFGKCMDPEGIYIKTYVPILKHFPPAYIHMPWTAPPEVQEQAQCIIGQDYPHPIVDVHKQESYCRDRMKGVITKFMEMALKGSPTQPLCLQTVQ